MLQRIHAWLRARADRRKPAHIRSARWGEDVAYTHIRGLGFRVVARNFRARSGRGEIDLIAWDDDRLAIVEVKTRKTDRFGAPEEAVDMDKRRLLIRTAQEYARRSRIDLKHIRYDVVSVIPGQPAPRIELIRDAFTEHQTHPGRVSR